MSIMQSYKSKLAQLNKISFVLKHSITKRLLVVVFSIYLILTVAVTLIQMNFEYETAKKQTVIALENIRAMTEDSLSQAIWEFNTQQIDSILSGIYTNKYLVGQNLEIINNDAIPELSNKQQGLIEDAQKNIVEVDQNSKAVTMHQNSLERLIPYSFQIYHQNEHGDKQVIATMHLYSSNKIVFDQVKENYILLIINAMIKTLALWIFFLWAGYKYISKPLGQLTEAIKRLSSGDWNTELVSKFKNEKDKTEINTLIDSFNEMTHKLFDAQLNLEYSHNRLNNIFNTMPSALIFIDHNFIINGWNKYAVQETGIAASDAIGKPILDVYAAFTDYLYLAKKALENRKEQQFKNARLIVENEDKDRIFNIVVYPIITSDKPEAVIRIDDVTEEVKSETGLAQVEKLASVGALIAGVAHEINNPLGSIMQGTQNVLRRIDPNLPANQAAAKECGIDLQVQQRYLEKREIISFLESIRTAGERASSIVKNMLKYTRRSTADMSKHNLVELIDDGIQLAASDYSLQDKINFNKITITKNFDIKEIYIDCYPMEIQQVILNLLKNAAQSLNEHQVDKIINIDLKKIAHDKVQISISDNGCGMPNEIKDQIFKPFFTTKPIGEGTGLGLSVCRNIIVQKHRGTIDVESTVNVGTKFTITLPISQAT